MATIELTQKDLDKSKAASSSGKRTQKTTDELKELKAPHHSGKQTLIWDAGLKGFGLLVSGKSPVRTFIVQNRLKDGRTRRITIGAENVLKVAEARERAKKILGEFFAGNDPKALAERRARRTQTLRMATDRYLEARKNLSPKTRKLYEHLITRHLASWLDKPLADITVEMIEERHAKIRAEVDRGPGQEGPVKTTGEGTANGVMRSFRAVYNFALDRDDTLPANPVRRLKRAWYAEKRRETLVPLDKLPAFHAAVVALDSRTASDYLRVLLFTGLRRREAAGLKWSEVDFAERAIRLPASRTKAKRKLDLPMSDVVFDLLVARRGIGIENEFVFPATSKSKHLEEPKFHLAQIKKTTGIAVTAHDLRRTFITVAEGSNISVMALKALVNHALGSDVTAGYAILTLDRLREPTQMVADRLKVLCKIPAIEGATPLRATK